jgi:hypothetical protein
VRELLAMSNGRLEAEWGQTAQILAMLANTNRDPKKPPIPVERFNPFAVKKRTKPDYYISAGKLGKMIGRKKD